MFFGNRQPKNDPGQRVKGREHCAAPGAVGFRVRSAFGSQSSRLRRPEGTASLRQVAHLLVALAPLAGDPGNCARFQGASWLLAPVPVPARGRRAHAFTVTLGQYSTW